MAKSSRTPESQTRKLSSSALRITDAFCNLQEVHRAFAGLQGLLSPIHRPSRVRRCRHSESRQVAGSKAVVLRASKLPANQDDPSPLRTTRKVRARIFASSPSDHSAAYRASRATRSA